MKEEGPLPKLIRNGCELKSKRLRRMSCEFQWRLDKIATDVSRNEDNRSGCVSTNGDDVRGNGNVLLVTKMGVSSDENTMEETSF